MKFHPFSRELLSVLLLASCVLTSPGQILQEWSHSAAIGEASAAIALDANYMIVADNEDEILRLYPRFPGAACTPATYSFNARPHLALSSSNPEADIEAGVRVDDDSESRLYWLASHSNSKSGNYRPNRLRLFATRLSGPGTGSEPYTLEYVGRYDRLRDDLIAWDRDNLHGLGSHYFGLAASAATGVLPTRIDGFNIEGLVVAPDGTTAYIAFRAPLVSGSGPTIAMDQRTHALLVPLLNLPSLVTGNPTTGPGAARFGAPITLDLGKRGVRSIDSSSPGQYLITAGPTDAVSYPPAAPNNFCFFTWSGMPTDTPVERVTEFPSGYEPEGAMLSSAAFTDTTEVQLVSDDSGGCFRSFTAAIGRSAGPALTITAAAGHIQVAWPASATRYQLQSCSSLTAGDWINSTATPASYGAASVAVSEPATGTRFYRLVKARY